jgi:hypothetical protein
LRREDVDSHPINVRRVARGIDRDDVAPQPASPDIADLLIIVSSCGVFIDAHESLLRIFIGDHLREHELIAICAVQASRLDKQERLAATSARIDDLDRVEIMRLREVVIGTGGVA